MCGVGPPIGDGFRGSRTRLGLFLFNLHKVVVVATWWADDTNLTCCNSDCTSPAVPHHRCPNPKACTHNAIKVAAFHPFNDSRPNRTATWADYEQHLCASPAYTGRLCSVCNLKFGQTDIFSCDPCLGVNDDGTGEVDTRWIMVMWAGYAVAFMGYLLVVLAVHLKENPPVTASEGTAMERKWATQPGIAAGTASSLPQPARTGTTRDAACEDVSAFMSSQTPARHAEQSRLHLPTSALIKTLTMFVQYLAGVIFKLPIVWPPVIDAPAARLSQAWGWLMGSGASIDCLLQASHSPFEGPPGQAGMKALISLLAPFAMFAVIVVVLLVWWLLLRRLFYSSAHHVVASSLASSEAGGGTSGSGGCRGLLGRLILWAAVPACYASLLTAPAGDQAPLRHWLRQESGTRPHFAAYMSNRLVPALLITAFFWYPSIARVALGIFACIQVCDASSRWWVLDMRSKCPRSLATAEGRWAFGVGVPAVFITVCVPLFVLVWLLANTSKLDNTAFKSRFAFMYSDYACESLAAKHNNWLHELVQPQHTLFLKAAAWLCELVKGGVAPHAQQPQPADNTGASSGKGPRKTPTPLAQRWEQWWRHVLEWCWVARHLTILIWDVVIHAHTVLLMMCSVYGIYGMHEYFQVLLMCGVFAVYMFLVMLVKPFKALNQVLQTLVSAVLLVTCLCTLVFVFPSDHLDSRQKAIQDRIGQGVGVFMLVLNGACVVLLLGLLMCKQLMYALTGLRQGLAYLTGRQQLHAPSGSVRVPHADAAGKGEGGSRRLSAEQEAFGEASSFRAMPSGALVLRVVGSGRVHGPG